MPLTLDTLNTCSVPEFAAALAGIYERSPWVAQRASAERPFASLFKLKFALQAAVKFASPDEQLALIRAHPELAGKAAIAGQVTAESLGEQAKAGLHACTPEELKILQEMNAAYTARFGFPFILAVKGPDGKGLTRHEIIAALARRLPLVVADEVTEALRQIGRIAELRLNDLFDVTLVFGTSMMACADQLASQSDDDDGLTCAYMRPVHRHCATQIARWMDDAGLQAHIDAVGNVVGRYRSSNPEAKTLITGSHYDTVKNAGKYDGRAGIILPILIADYLRRLGETLPFHLEIIAFAEEEGVRFQSTFLGSSAVIGHFDPAWLDQRDTDGVSMREALQDAGHDPADIPAIARNPADLLGFIELHIEQGPVLLGRDMPVGLVTAIAGCNRYIVELVGVAGHAGTTPMAMRQDAVAAAGEIIWMIEQYCNQYPEFALVGTVGQLHVPAGSINVIPGRCVFSLDIRATDDVGRAKACRNILHAIEAICRHRKITPFTRQILSGDAVQCASSLTYSLQAAAGRVGVPGVFLTSGAGHDAMRMANITDVAMLFIRCGNGGISHNPLETMTADDAEVAAQVFLDFLRNLKIDEIR